MDVILHRAPVYLFEPLRRQHIPRWPDEASPATETEDPRGVAIDEAQLVRDEQQGEAPGPLQAIDLLVEPFLTRLIDAGRRLVEEQHAGAPQEGKGQQEPLELASREGPDRLPDHVLGEIDQVECGTDIGGRGVPDARLGPKKIVAADGQVALDVELLRDIGRPASEAQRISPS